MAYGPKPLPFYPRNTHKYKGKLPIITRSALEINFARWLDLQTNCIQWGCESVIVNYNDPSEGGKSKRYFIDFYGIFRQKDGKLKKFYIEVKPHRQTLQPVNSKNKKPATYLKECQIFDTNTAKWESATKYAKLQGSEFIVITELDIQIL